VVADLVADLQRAGIWPITHYLASWQRSSWSAVYDQPRSCLRPG